MDPSRKDQFQGYPPPYAGGAMPGMGFAGQQGPAAGGPPPMGWTPMPQMMPPPQMHMGPQVIVERPDHDKGFDNPEGMAFSDKSIRAGFIRKVYSILAVMLTIVLGFIILFNQHEGIKKFTRANRWVYFVSVGVLFVVSMMLSCCSTFRRRAPGNFICLGIFTIAAGFALGSVSSFYSEQSVLLAVGITAVICIGLTIFSFQTKWDFTKLNGVLFVCLIVLFCLSIAGIFFHVQWLRLLICGFGAVLFSVYLIHDTQMIIGGNHKYQISPEEYIFAALMLFLDIYNIFVSILGLLGSSD